MTPELNLSEMRLFSKICKATVLELVKGGKKSRYTYDNRGQSKNMYKEELADDLKSLENLITLKIIERENRGGHVYYFLTHAGYLFMLESKNK